MSKITTPVNIKTDSNMNPIIPIKESDFSGQQLDLFQSFLCNNNTERDKLSNTFDLWDSVPRYSVSRQQMDKIRKEKGFLDLLKINFQYRGKTMQAIIQAARVYNEKNGETIDYYPSANEELIEDALRKIAAEQNQGYFDKPNYRSGVVFTLYMLRQELKKRGHSRSYQEIILSLNILASSVIEIRTVGGKKSECFNKSGYFSGIAGVSKNDLLNDSKAKWVVQFHPLVTQEIDALTYRQYNYAQMMNHSNQLTRWLHKQLSVKFTFASPTTTFDMRYSTIKRDSALLEGYKRGTAAVDMVDVAFAELKDIGLLISIKKNIITGPRGKIEDVIYTLMGSLDFAAQMKAANKRKQIAEEQLNKIR